MDFYQYPDEYDLMEYEDKQKERWEKKQEEAKEQSRKEVAEHYAKINKYYDNKVKEVK